MNHPTGMATFYRFMYSFLKKAFYNCLGFKLYNTLFAKSREEIGYGVGDPNITISFKMIK